ncbi:glutathione synthase [Sphingobacterium allocomposti]|uniref:Glutathione synthase n=1 Tax=Sphingobacterium allocomposti TaxID=415956 RepID=A0A5S5DMU5_9SPHI|nr:glutathione synthase [Sphingobacterium composti Yoo et al. 2007 non Ten et al. 2007]TYP96974.1 glutathione synthase [Sphingobacterium composti Yoo et al. 2007 non Ten et al. 2007]
MNIAFLINQTHKEEASFTTTLLAFKAHLRGHRILYIGLADFAYSTDQTVGAHCRIVDADERVTDPKHLLETLRKKEKQFVDALGIDILWIRYDPVLDMISRPWASPTALQFAQLMKRQGTWVINDPDKLVEATNKLYLEYFPKSVRAQTLITRNHEDVVRFLEQQPDQIILKPLKGSGGKNVFLLKKDERHNLKQTVEVIARDGYVLAQEYLPAAAEGDIRFFLLDGEPLVVDGKYASVNRVQQKGDIRSNIHQGGTAQAAHIDEDILATVNQVTAKLREDGMYFVGLDIVGDKIMEINVFSPGALLHASQLNDVDYATAILTDLEKKLAQRKAKVTP